MPVGQSRTYEEALALWRALSDAPPPPGDAAAILEAALRLRPPEGYDRFASRYLDDPSISWAVYRDAPSHFA